MDGCPDYKSVSTLIQREIHSKKSFKHTGTSSRLNRTPPIGAPNATDTPAAAAADNTCMEIGHNIANSSDLHYDIYHTSRFLQYLGNKFERRLPQQQAMWTRGPSFPRLNPAPTLSTIPRHLTSKVHACR